MSDGIAAAREAIKSLGFFSSASLGEMKVERLGGLTSPVYRIDCAGLSYALRVPSTGTQEYINRKAEAVAARGAALAGVSPEVIVFDESTGVMLTDFIHDIIPMTPELFKRRPGSPARAGQIFKQLHTSAAAFGVRFDLFRLIDDYLKVLSAKTVKLPEGYRTALKEADAARAALAARTLPSAPCHCDPLCENFLDTGTRMWLVDWQYAGMNDPMWDLGGLSIEAGFSPRQEEEMVRAYFGREAGAAERGRMVIYKALNDLLWTLWGLIQHASGNPGHDFWAYSVNRFNRCKALMADGGFARHVGAVRAG